MIDTVARENVMKLARAYAKATGFALTTISKGAYGNGGFLADFERGRTSITIDKLATMLKWFEDNWPEGLPPPYLPVLNMTPRRRRNN